MTATFLKPGEPEELTRILAASDRPETDRLKAGILLDLDRGLTARVIAEQRAASVQRVLYWRREYLKRGLGIFEDADE